MKYSNIDLEQLQAIVQGCNERDQWRQVAEEYWNFAKECHRRADDESDLAALLRIQREASRMNARFNELKGKLP